MQRIDPGAEEALRFGLQRSPEWPRVARAYLAEHPHCACCKPGDGGAAVVRLQVHHVFPFHYCVVLGRPDLELDARNLITLCERGAGEAGENHHLLVGHLDSFQSANLQVRTDVREFYGMAAERIRGDARWKAKVMRRVKGLEGMTAGERREMRERMDERMPRRA